jgi:uncharacterized Zn finger protein
MDDFMSILGKGFVPETADQVAEAGIFVERPDGETGTSPKGGISPILPEPLPLDLEAFWGRLSENPKEEKSPSLEAHIPPVPAALPKRLGKFPFWSGEEDLLEMLEEIYKKASPAGMMIFLGERK